MRIQAIFSMVIVAAIAGAVSERAFSDEADITPALRSAPTGRIADTPVSCVAVGDLSHARMIDGTLLFDGKGGTLWRNGPTGGCPMRPGRTLLTRPNRDRLCAGDVAEVVTLPGPVRQGSCSLGNFIPYSRVG